MGNRRDKRWWKRVGEIKNCKEKEEDIVYTMGKTSKKEYRPKPQSSTTRPSIPNTTTHNSTAKIF